MNDAPLIRRNLTIDGELFALVVTTHHDGAVATTAVHRQDFPRHIGGARFVEAAGGLSEVGHLASTMTEKCMAAMVPADGQKTVIVIGPVHYVTEERRTEILIEHVRLVKELDPGVIFGPDMNSPESVMDRAARAEGLLDQFTGLSEANRGLSIDSNGYTAHGLVAAIRACIDDGSLVKQRVSIQGFGAVGAHAARLLAELGAKVVAVNNKDVLLTNADGLDVPALFANRLRHGDDGLRYASQERGLRISHTPDDIFRVPADIFIPAGRTDILTMSNELEHVRQTVNPYVNDVAEFHSATGVRLVVEGANHPISPEAEYWLESKGVRILPEFIVNCGGLIGCWVEWEARHHESMYSTAYLPALAERALERIQVTVRRNVREILAAGMPMRDAAEQIVRRNKEELRAGWRDRYGADISLAETFARTELRVLRYHTGAAALRDAMSRDPDRTERLQSEFGFLLGAGVEDGNAVEASAGALERLRWSAQIWRTVAAGNALPLVELKSPPNKAPAVEEPRDTAVKAQEGTAQQKGDVLESAVERLFRTFFSIGDEIPWKIRRQNSGSQYGHDLSIEWSGRFDAVGKPKVRCHIECKNYRKEITLREVAPKLLSERQKNSVIDHWILIGPRSDPSNELNRFLEEQRQEERFPFNVQVWSRETGLDRFFGLEPAVYDEFYEPVPGEAHPRDWDDAKRDAVREEFRKRLEPVLRLPPGWLDYINNPARLCIHRENPDTMNQEYAERVAMRCCNDAGVPLEKPLDDYVDDWLSSDDPHCLLLGEFGAGKTLFTYSLARRLVAGWQRGTGVWLPLRLSLKNLPSEPRDVLRLRLEEFGANMAGWNAIASVAKRLVILDGFDEISTNIDPDTVTGNIGKLLACIDEFASCKVLITSRKEVFRNLRDAKRLQTRIGRVLTLAPISRNEVVRSLRAAATDAEGRQRIERLRSMHDPIGLARKPLFLEMLKGVLVDREMPADFDVVTLYERYITRSLSRKAELLDDPAYRILLADTIANLRVLLGEVAEELQRTGLGYFRLGAFKGSSNSRFAKLLWGQNGPESLDQDATARIGGRSLLCRLDADDNGEWPVDFCHRSMREYFVAERLCTALSAGRNDAEAFLHDVPVSHEILQFAVQQLRKSGSDHVEDTLLALLDGATPTGVGGRALTLFYQLKKTLPRSFDWRRKNFDGADLEDADLSRFDFSGSSLRNANLTNVNFEHSNFSGCDLTGVSIEETKPVAALAVDPSGEGIIAAYSDGVLRSWELRPDGRSASTQAGEWSGGIGGSMGLHETGQVWLHADNQWWLLNRQENGRWEQTARFRTADGLAGIFPRANVLAVTRSGFDGAPQVATLVDLERNGKLFTATPGATLHCAPLGSEGLVWSDDAIGFRVETMSSTGLLKTVALPCRRPSSLDVRTRSNDTYVVAGGTEDGSVHIWTIEVRDDAIVSQEIFKRSIHKGAVTGVALFEDERVASGGIRLRRLGYELG